MVRQKIHPVVISDELWKRLQELISKRFSDRRGMKPSTFVQDVVWDLVNNPELYDLIKSSAFKRMLKAYRQLEPELEEYGIYSVEDFMGELVRSYIRERKREVSGVVEKE